MNEIVKRPTTNGTQKASALNVMATRLSCEPDKLLATLKATVFAKASNEEMLALVVVANEYELNPLLKELYAFPAKGGGIVPIVSVDGWNKMLNRQKGFDGIEFDMVDGEDGKPITCTATVYVKERSKPVKVTEYYEECYRNTDPWNNMPHRMLRNRTLCQAARVAFGFAGVYDPEEAAPMIVDVSEPPPKQVKLVAASSEQHAPEQPAADSNPTKELEKMVLDAGYTFDHFQKWGRTSGMVPEADSLSGFGDVKADVAKRLLRAKTGLMNGLQEAKGGE